MKLRWSEGHNFREERTTLVSHRVDETGHALCGARTVAESRGSLEAPWAAEKIPAGTRACKRCERKEAA